MIGLLPRRVRLRAHVFLYRWSGGSIGARRAGEGYDLPILLLTTTGSKSGKSRTVALSYMMDGPNYVVIGSHAGRAKDPAWIGNLRAHPRATVQLKRARIPVLPEQADPEQKRRLWAELVKAAPIYNKYQGQTSRDIPMMILRPRG